jgi:stress-induced morphogen
MPSLADVQALIERAIPGAQVTIEDFAGGGGDHLAARVVAEQFAGLSRLEQHRMVYSAVERELGSGAIHALSIKTSVPARADAEE